MKGDDPHSIVLPVAFKRATSRGAGLEGDFCSKSVNPAVANRKSTELFPRNVNLKGFQLEQQQRDDLASDIRCRSSPPLPDHSLHSITKPAAISQHAVVHTCRKSAAATLPRLGDDKNAANSGSADQAPAVREMPRNHVPPSIPYSGSDRTIRDNPVCEDGRTATLIAPVSCHATPPVVPSKSNTPFSDTSFLYAGSVAAGLGRPSCSEESSSDTSDLSLDDAHERVMMRDGGYRDDPPMYDGSSCSSSGSMSPLSLHTRLLDMKLHRSNESRRDHSARVGAGGGHPAAAFEKKSNTSDVQAGLVGLHNEGNTCYLNSCLQCLAHTLPLASAILGPYSDQIQKRGGGTRHGVPERDWASLAELLTYAFHQIVRDLWGRPPYSTASAGLFLQCVQAFAPQFSGSYQHDAQEVMRAILDGLHEALNRVKVAGPYRDLYVEPKPEIELAELTWQYHKSCHDSIIQDIFCGQLQSTIECSVCHRKSHCFDPFMDLSLPLPKPTSAGLLGSRESFRNSHHRQRVTLQDCLTEFGAPEQLEGSNKYYCLSCKAPRTSSKKLSIFRLPPVLVLHIKRFYGVERNSYTKDETTVYYPLKGLDLSNLMGAKARKVQGNLYDLYAVCCHVGSMGFGHYTAHCKNCDNNVWYCFNDKSVRPAQDAAVLTSSAYILFYQQRAL